MASNGKTDASKANADKKRPVASVADEPLPDFDAIDEQKDGTRAKTEEKAADIAAAIKASGFKDFLLKDELVQGIVDCGFEHPSEVQHACIPQAILGTDVLCQAKSGMGKTAVFVLTCIQAIDTSTQALRTLVVCHTRELAYQIQHEFKRLGKHVPGLKIAAVFGGVPFEVDKEKVQKQTPHVLVGTPGRLLQLVNGGDKAPVKLKDLSHFIIDECDKCLDMLDMRRDVQKLFIQTPKEKQVMMFSATISPETRAVCKKFMQNPHEITVDPSKLTLQGLLQYYAKLDEKQKNKKLIDLLDSLEFNQVVIFVKTVKRALALDGLLNQCKFPSMTLHEKENGNPAKRRKISGGATDGRIERLQLFKDFKKRILVTTDLFGRGMDVERVNIVINYDMPDTSDMYLHRVGRAGRFGTKGLALSFVTSEADVKVMGEVQSRFEVNLPEMPETIDTTSYLNA